MKKIFYFILLQLSCIAFAQVGIGTTSPNAKSMLDVVSNTKGVLLPRMSQVQRDAILPGTIDANRDGLLIYNTDTGCYNYWNITQKKWVSLCQTSCDPSTFADFTMNCSQFPAADTNTYATGSSVSGNTITVSVDVTHIGPYAINIISDNGISYSAVGTFTTTGVQNVTIANANGSPSSSTINFTVKSNGISVCTYTKNSSGSVAAYNYNCTMATVTPTMIQGVSGTGIVKVPVIITGTKDIPAINQTINGVSYTFAGISGATSAITSIDIAYSGTPSTANTSLSMTNSDGSLCNIDISHPAVNAAIFTCSSVSVTGTYTVATELTSSNKVYVTVNVSQPGKLRLLSTDKNGILFDSGELTVTTGAQTVILKAAIAKTGKFPMTAEEVSMGANGSNNQSSTYSINNTINGGSHVGCSFSIDVKPKVWQTMYNGEANSRQYGADNGMIRLEMQDNSNFQLGVPGYYKVWVKNLTGSTMSTSVYIKSSDDPLQEKKWNGSINSNEALGSIDCYLQANTSKPITTGEIGAHAGPNVLLPELSETGATFTLYNTSGSKWFNGLGNKKFKYRLIFNSRDHALKGTNMAVVLYGIYDTSVSVSNYNPGELPMTPGGAGGNPLTGYWP
ncbi:hypothetical protein SAMN06265171_105276 [Chryseobacterium rhizoplanae]|uniref:Uncharacterized protein n=1 Tax=Chryseobacterium rhizoplanae TaxID=1609531 RepID=A0A521DME6_9FLAO|nr:hypothetical protein [Chryseobacterium rhizoplanae]SMO72772.1 hypothetical protein SAMN06265171_105276 [Chryseobacterium rhizoplanae]